HSFYLKAIANDSLKGSKKYAQHYADIMDNAIKLNDSNEVQLYLNPLHKSFSKVVSLRSKIGYYESAANAYKLLKNHEKIAIFLDSILQIKDSLSNKRHDDDLLELDSKYQTSKKEEQLKLEKERRKQWIYISLSVLVILIIMIILLLKNNKKRTQLQLNKIALEQLLKQRNMLLKETHHRVKNSFQMVSSLLQLQSEGTKAKTAVTALENAVQRVNSMIVLHQQLYSKDDLLGIDSKYQTSKKEEQLKLEKERRKQWIYISLSVLVILIIMIILLLKNNKKRTQLQLNKIALEQLLKQRNMLLKETHHRVKNSFQMVSSLLQLQSEGTKAKTAVTALENAVQRVNSMIVLHQQLYSKDDLLGIEIKIYIQDLIKEILNSYPSENIHIIQNIDSLIFDIDIATSLGLLINELATNSIKHAWDESSNNKMITIEILKENEFTIFNMFDNGNVKKSKHHQENYGSKLINILIERLNAIVEQKNDDFSINIKFKA
ncbi:MAG: hypothetical protein GW772_13755, partial [Flavobacteriia bacterium]|nr:hypothetical protein [Flavobacteriia bacterium]